MPRDAGRPKALVVTRTVAAFRVWVPAGVWSALAFVLNLAWEIAHARLYTLWLDADGPRIAWSLLHCSLGDVVIALAMFGLAGVALRDWGWPVSRPWAGGMIVVIGAMTFTVWSEWYNVYRTGAWSYTPDMPTVYGIGLSPLLQWLIIPAVLVVISRALALSHHASRVRPRARSTPAP